MTSPPFWDGAARAAALALDVAGPSPLDSIPLSDGIAALAGRLDTAAGRPALDLALEGLAPDATFPAVVGRLAGAFRDRGTFRPALPCPCLVAAAAALDGAPSRPAGDLALALALGAHRVASVDTAAAVGRASLDVDGLVTVAAMGAGRVRVEAPTGEALAVAAGWPGGARPLLAALVWWGSIPCPWGGPPLVTVERFGSGGAGVRVTVSPVPVVAREPLAPLPVLGGPLAARTVGPTLAAALALSVAVSERSTEAAARSGWVSLSVPSVVGRHGRAPGLAAALSVVGLEVSAAGDRVRWACPEAAAIVKAGGDARAAGRRGAIAAAAARMKTGRCSVL